MATAPKKVIKGAVTPAVKLIDVKADLITLIDSIANRGKKLDTDIHRAAVSVLVHAVKHGDITLADRLRSALPASGRKNALTAWFCAYGPFAVGEKDQLLYRKLDDGEFNVTAAIAEPFWQYAPEPKFVPFDLKAELQKLVKKAQKAATGEHATENSVDQAVLATITKLIGVTE